MLSSAKTYTIAEYGRLCRGADRPGYTGLPAITFDALRQFLLENRGQGTEVIELLSLSAQKHVGEVISAKNHVGVISMSDGTAIEILPKIAGQDLSRGAVETRQIFIDMLRTLNDPLFKSFDTANLGIAKIGLLEVFISMFLSEVSTLTKRGLRSAYLPNEENSAFFKGKLLVNQHVQHNSVRRDRFYVQHDVFSLDRPENRLIRSALEYVAKATRSSANKTRARDLHSRFEGVSPSTNHAADFAKTGSDRSVSHYARALAWSRVFLQRKSFTAFSGSSVAVALLFPMEVVFESWVADKVRKHAPAGVSVRTQDSRFSLFEQPTKFRLRPDIVIGSETPVVLDTKWKLLNSNLHNHGISQADMYQMYAYGKKYQAERVVLLYPKSEAVTLERLRFDSGEGVTVDVEFIDLARPYFGRLVASAAPFS